jgi:hypothetical protein
MRKPDADDLLAHMGRVVQLYFWDGNAVEAKLLCIDRDASGSELIYDVVKVVDVGSLDPSKVQQGVVYVCSLADLRGWQLLD